MLGLAIYSKQHADVWDSAAALLREHAGELSAHRMQSLGRDREGLLPADFPPAVALSQEWTAQPVGVLLEVGQRGRLGAEVAATERVSGIAADGDDPPGVYADHEAADRLAEIAGPVVRFHGAPVPTHRSFVGGAAQSPPEQPTPTRAAYGKPRAAAYCVHRSMQAGGGLRSLISFAFNGDDANETMLFDAFIAAMTSVPPDPTANTFGMAPHGNGANREAHASLGRPHDARHAQAQFAALPLKPRATASASLMPSTPAERMPPA